MQTVGNWLGVKSDSARSESIYLVSFADPETRQKACSALPDPAAKAWRQFFFADHPGLLLDFKTAWHDAAGTPARCSTAQEARRRVLSGREHPKVTIS